MRTAKHDKILWMTGLAALINLAIGWSLSSWLLVGIGAAGLCYFGLRGCGWGPARSTADPKIASLDGELRDNQLRDNDPRARLEIKDAKAGDTGSLVEEMLAQGRHALLLRPQVVGNLSQAMCGRCWQMLERDMALVPAGKVEIGLVESPGDEFLADADGYESEGSLVMVGEVFLDRHPVTNRKYHDFVTSAGYENVSLWDPQVLPAVLDFVDQTGQPGPRFWKNGCYADGEAELPVVGISWFEAAAYARWVGKRLPTEAEWMKAGSWPVPLSDTRQLQRKYPWGETMDRGRANLWGSGPGQVVAVTDYPEGVSVGGVYQLIGNVWEWTTGNFGSLGPRGRDLSLPVPMKSIRGGAFDTYFDNQATCQFQSGENPVARKHNIGFRCAVSVGDLSAGDSAPSDEQADDDLMAQEMMHEVTA